MTNEYDELEKRAKKFLKYERRLDLVKNYAYWIITFPSLIVFALAIKFFLNRDTQISDVIYFLGVIMAIIMVSSSIIGRKARKYRLDDDEWALFYTSSIVKNLLGYINTKNIDRKKDYQKSALKNAEDFLACIEKRWKIGSFKLAKEHFEKPLSELKDNIRNRLIPALKDGDNETLITVGKILSPFQRECTSLDLEKIKNLNQQLSCLSKTERIEVGLRKRLSTFFSSHKIVKHGVFISILALACCIFYYISVSLIMIAKEYAFGGSVAIFIGVLTIYFAKQPKE